MGRCYSALVPIRHPSNAFVARSALPVLWLISDARNDAGLERALARLPRGSGFIFRHYHLPPAERRVRFTQLAHLARRHGHCVVLAGAVRTARMWGADGAYGNALQLHSGAKALRLVTVHSLRELRQSHHARADAVLLSPVFATRSHPGSRGLGPLRFHSIASFATVPVVALGGMTKRRAQAHRMERWAAIDGLCGESQR